MRKFLLPALAAAALVALAAPAIVSSPIQAQTVTATQTQGTVIKITSAAQFDDIIAKSTTPIIVDFKADWCGPCHRFAPIFEQAAKDFAGKVTFLQVDVDENDDLSNRYKIQFIPAVKLFKPGNTKPAAESGGFRDLNAVKGWLKTNANVVP